MHVLTQHQANHVSGGIALTAMADRSGKSIIEQTRLTPANAGPMWVMSQLVGGQDQRYYRTGLEMQH